MTDSRLITQQLRALRDGLYHSTAAAATYADMRASLEDVVREREDSAMLATIEQIGSLLRSLTDAIEGAGNEH